MLTTAITSDDCVAVQVSSLLPAAAAAVTPHHLTHITSLATLDCMSFLMPRDYFSVQPGRTVDLSTVICLIAYRRPILAYSLTAGISFDNRPV